MVYWAHIRSYINNKKRKAKAMENIEKENEKRLLEFVRQIIAEKGLEEVENKEELEKQLMDELTEQISQALLFALPEDKFQELEAMGDNFTEEAFTAKVKEANLDVNQITEETMERFKKVFMEIELEEA